MDTDKDLWGELQSALDRVGDAIEEFGDQFELRVPEVSGWSVGQHLEHVLKATDHNLRAIRLIEEGEDERLEDVPLNRVAEGLFAYGTIKRGIAESPPPVVPSDQPSAIHARGEFARLRAEFDGLEKSPDHWSSRGLRMAHPALGPLGAMEWVAFSRIHDDHHLEIIREIAAAAGEGAKENP